MKLPTALLLIASGISSNLHLAIAQSADTGRVLDSVQPRPSTANPQTAPQVLQKANPQAVPTLPDAMQQIDVREFRIEGFASLSQARLQQAVAPLAGRSMTPPQMQQAADAVTQIYRDAGYPLVQALVLPQSIDNGIVVITVREDQLSSVEVSSKQAPALVQSGLSNALTQQKALNTSELEQALLLINNLPGRGRASAEIIAPEQGNASKVSAQYAPAPKIQGSVTLDTAGNRLTGRGRVLGQLVINEPFGAADQLSLTLLGTDSPLIYAQGAYRFPLTPRLTLGASLSQLDYKLCCQASTVTSKGSAQSFGLDATYQLSLNRSSSSAIYANLDSRRLSNQRNGVKETQRQVDALGVGLRGYSSQTALRSWSVALRGGRTDLNGNAIDLVQNATSDVQGTFSKVSASFYQSQSLTPALSWQFQSRGQLNLGRNLEGSERFALGGADGIRAYPSGEAVGDSGWLVSAELRYAIAAVPGLSLATFVDAGGVRRYSKNANALLALMNQPGNRYTLAGAGLGLRYDSAKVNLTLQVAKPIGSNRGADAAGNNNESRRDGQAQGWISAAWKF